MALVLFLALSFFLQGALGGIICEQLPVELCSFSVSSSAKRCLLENFAASDGRTAATAYQCKTSEVAVINTMKDWIESDECVTACGVDRKSVGISSDSLLQPHFTAKLCSDGCYQSCPNIVDLYFNLALGEGVYLPSLCQKQRSNPRRLMPEIKSSGAAAAAAKSPVSCPGPASSESSSHLSSSSSSAMSPMSSEDEYLTPGLAPVAV